MRNKSVQMSLLDIYKDVEERLESDKPAVFKLFDEHINWHEIIPDSFYFAFYKKFGRNRKYDLESFMRALFLQRIFHYVEDSQLLNTLNFSREMREYCEFDKVPDASKLTRFKQNFCEYIREVFENLVEITESICREMDKKLADELLFDTTGIESCVAENNPKFPRTKAGETVEFTGVANSNPAVKLQYINGHMCYAQRAVVITNGLGIVRHLELFDEDFKKSHPEMRIEKRTNNPEVDKEIGDSTALKPILNDFHKTHPKFIYSTFSGDSAFDSYDNYRFLLNEYGFSKAVIPLRNFGVSDINFNEHGTPLCPADGTPFVYWGRCDGIKRSARLKFVCPRSQRVETTLVNQCKNPCTASKYGRCVYVQVNKNLRLYPGIARDSDEFAEIYKRRTTVERSINTLKETLGVANRKTSNVLTTKADLFLAGIVQLICVLLAHKLHDRKLARSPRRLIA
jgi:histone H3/H4